MIIMLVFWLHSNEHARFSFTFKNKKIPTLYSLSIFLIDLEFRITIKIHLKVEISFS